MICASVHLEEDHSNLPKHECLQAWCYRHNILMFTCMEGQRAQSYANHAEAPHPCCMLRTVPAQQMSQFSLEGYVTKQPLLCGVGLAGKERHCMLPAQHVTVPSLALRV